MATDHVTISASAPTSDSDRWIREGWRMAEAEHQAAFESIELKHAAELRHTEAEVRARKVRGQEVLSRRDALEVSLAKKGFDLAEHLRELAQGNLDLTVAVGLLVLNAALALLVLLPFGPTSLTVPLALLVLVSAVPIEEFFQAEQDRDVFRESMFIVLSVLALGALFWLGTVRGLFLAAFTQADAGPISTMLAEVGSILRYTLGVLAVGAECLCGYKLYQARSRLLSATAKAVRERDRCNAELIGLCATIDATVAEPDIRRDYRQIGARQYLASAKLAESKVKDPNAHLRKAAIGALVALLVLGAFLFFTASAFGSPVPGRQVVVLLDFTKSVPSESFQANVQAVSSILDNLES